MLVNVQRNRLVLKITFKPDAEIFEETHFDYATLREHFQETAFLTKGVKIIFKDEREGQQAENVFHYEVVFVSL